MFPEKLRENIYKLIENKGLNFLNIQAKELTQRYRSQKLCNYMETEGHRLAYLLVRMPATYACIISVLKEVILKKPFLETPSFLDLGAGPGTGLWAVQEIFPQCNTITLFEKDPSLMAIGKKLSEGKGRWVLGDLEKAEIFDPHDLVLLSFALGELKDPENVALKAWEVTKKLLIIIEPGTPVGFERLKKIRELLLAKGGFLIAPCPHSQNCPLQKNDWCHFSVRLARTSLHRQMKGGQLGYEDEKFFYLVFSKSISPQQCHGRILRHPQKHPGYVEMTICGQDGIQRKIFTRKEKGLYKWARDAKWGDEIN